MIYPFDTRRSPLIEGAIAFCVGAHGAIGQKRKYTGEAYHHHPLEVASLVAMNMVGATEEMLAAAVLHDVVEDTAVTVEVIADLFGPVVADYVEQLTDVSKPSDGNRAARKALDRDHIAKASPQAKTIKLADMISNIRSVAIHDPAFAVVYMEEKRQQLEVLTDGDPTLFMMAYEMINGARGTA